MDDVDLDSRGPHSISIACTRYQPAMASMLVLHIVLVYDTTLSGTTTNC